MADPSASAPTANAAALADVAPWAGIAATALSLLLVLGLAWLMLRWLRRSQRGGRAGNGPRVLHAVGLGPRERLVVVRHRDAEYLLAVTPASVSLIDKHQVEETQARAEPTL